MDFNVNDKASIIVRDKHIDVTIKRLSRRQNKAWVQLDDSDKDSAYKEVDMDDLDTPMFPSINQRFKFFESLTNMAITGKIRSLFVSGEGGVGKSYTLIQALQAEELEEDEDYLMIKGRCTAYALYKLLEDNDDKIVIFDDADDVLLDGTALNILKTVLDTQGTRRVRWISKGRDDSFIFTGTVIFLSNIAKSKIDQAILSRSVIIDLFMTVDEKIERMRHVLPFLEDAQDLNNRDRKKVLDLIAKYRNTIEDLNIRTLIKGLLVYKESKDLELTKYQILNG